MGKFIDWLNGRKATLTWLGTALSAIGTIILQLVNGDVQGAIGTLQAAMLTLGGIAGVHSVAKAIDKNNTTAPKVE